MLQILIATSISAFILIQYIDSHANILVFVCPYDWYVVVLLLYLAGVWVWLFSCSDDNSIYDCYLNPEWPIELQFLLYLSFLWMANHGEQALPMHWGVNLQGSPLLFPLLSYSLVCLCMTPNCIDVDACAWYCLSLFILWLCLDSQPVMGSCSPGLYNILMLYWCIYSDILWS